MTLAAPPTSAEALAQLRGPGFLVWREAFAAGTVELKRRSDGAKEDVSIDSALARLTA